MSKPMRWGAICYLPRWTQQAEWQQMRSNYKEIAATWRCEAGAPEMVPSRYLHLNNGSRIYLVNTVILYPFHFPFWVSNTPMAETSDGMIIGSMNSANDTFRLQCCCLYINDNYDQWIWTFLESSVVRLSLAVWFLMVFDSIISEYEIKSL